MLFSFNSLRFNKLATLIIASAIMPAVVGCNSEVSDTAVEPTVEESAAEPAEDATATQETIVDIASSNGSFDTLVAAVQAADLVDTLEAEGPYTVFAPTDEAFAALPSDVLDKLLLPENKEALTQILTYHVVSGEIPSSAVETGRVPTVGGADLDVVAENGSVLVDGASVVTPDVTASNGVIHVIDAVLIPPTVDPASL